jgi:hypothetical protein
VVAACAAALGIVDLDDATVTSTLAIKLRRVARLNFVLD